MVTIMKTKKKKKKNNKKNTSISDCELLVGADCCRTQFVEMDNYELKCVLEMFNSFYEYEYIYIYRFQSDASVAKAEYKNNIFINYYDAPLNS